MRNKKIIDDYHVNNNGCVCGVNNNGGGNDVSKDNNDYGKDNGSCKNNSTLCKFDDCDGDKDSEDNGNKYSALLKCLQQNHASYKDIKMQEESVQPVYVGALETTLDNNDDSTDPKVEELVSDKHFTFAPRKDDAILRMSKGNKLSICEWKYKRACNTINSMLQIHSLEYIKLRYNQYTWSNRHDKSGCEEHKMFKVLYQKYMRNKKIIDVYHANNYG